MTQLNDQDVIRYAARAAGYKITQDNTNRPNNDGPFVFTGDYRTGHVFDPKNSAIDSQALQVKLRLSLAFAENQILCGRFGVDPEPLIATTFDDDVTHEQLEAIARVVVLAAAGKIGSMLQ